MSPTLLEWAIAILLVWIAWRIGKLLTPWIIYRLGFGPQRRDERARKYFLNKPKDPKN